MADDLKVAIGDTWQPKGLSYFAVVMMALMLITNVLNLKFVSVLGFSIIASQISYILSLIIADIMAEVYGYRRVRRLLYVGLGCLVLYAVFLQVAVILPPAPGYASDPAFREIFSQTPRIVTASIAAYFVTELTNSYIMSRLKIGFKARYFYGRALTSVAIAQVINGATFYAIAYGGVLPLSTIVSAASFSWAVVMLCEFVILPVTKQLAMAVKRYEGIEHFDSQPSGLAAPPVTPA